MKKIFVWILTLFLFCNFAFINEAFASNVDSFKAPEETIFSPSDLENILNDKSQDNNIYVVYMNIDIHTSHEKNTYNLNYVRNYETHAQIKQEYVLFPKEEDADKFPNYKYTIKKINPFYRPEYLDKLLFDYLNDYEYILKNIKDEKPQDDFFYTLKVMFSNKKKIELTANQTSTIKITYFLYDFLSKYYHYIEETNYAESRKSNPINN
ncbi:hypothetical protein II906_09860 [bacterium]|nr:hypothetical protein [bacterium]